MFISIFGLRFLFYVYRGPTEQPKKKVMSLVGNYSEMFYQTSKGEQAKR